MHLPGTVDSLQLVQFVRCRAVFLTVCDVIYSMLWNDCWEACRQWLALSLLHCVLPVRILVRLCSCTFVLMLCCITYPFNSVWPHLSS